MKCQAILYSVFHNPSEIQLIQSVIPVTIMHFGCLLECSLTSCLVVRWRLESDNELVASRGATGNAWTYDCKSAGTPSRALHDWWAHTTLNTFTSCLIFLALNMLNLLSQLFDSQLCTWQNLWDLHTQRIPEKHSCQTCQDVIFPAEIIITSWRYLGKKTNKKTKQEQKPHNYIVPAVWLICILTRPNEVSTHL